MPGDGYGSLFWIGDKMADATAIAAVVEMLGPDAATNGYDDTKIGTDLDGGKTPNAIALSWWRKRTAQLSNMVDTSESGSSRSLGQGWQHAQAMLTYYQGQVTLENPPINPKGSLRSYPIRRV